MYSLLTSSLPTILQSRVACGLATPRFGISPIPENPENDGDRYGGIIYILSIHGTPTHPVQYCMRQLIVGHLFLVTGPLGDLLKESQISGCPTYACRPQETKKEEIKVSQVLQ